MPIEQPGDSGQVQQILAVEYLRRLYAKATDLIGTGQSADLDLGLQIYQRIFTADVQIRTTGGTGEGFAATGPDKWAEVVAGALAQYNATQHLIGTQLVEISNVQRDADGRLQAGEATMESYLNAWHARPERTVYVFIGTYFDKVRYTPDSGWQIYDMTLQEVSSENREMGDLPRD
ncbi:MAG: nuclear transport factor 2 family protein [Pseudomonadota bacterium]